MSGGRRVFRTGKRAFSVKDVARVKPYRDFELDTHISLKHAYVFLQVSKAASSTVVWHLQRAEFEGSGFTVQDPNNKYVSPHLSPFQLPTEMLAHVMTSPEYLKVAFVRNPFSRLLSCYLHRIVQAPRSPSARRFRAVSGDAEIPCFGRFVEVVCRQASRDMDRHWRVQSDDVLGGLVTLDFVGRFECLRSDLERLEGRLFGDEVFDRRDLARMNSSPMATGADSRVAEYYNADLAKQVSERFAEDFERFGYTREIQEKGGTE